MIETQFVVRRLPVRGQPGKTIREFVKRSCAKTFAKKLRRRFKRNRYHVVPKRRKP